MQGGRFACVMNLYRIAGTVVFALHCGGDFRSTSGNRRTHLIKQVLKLLSERAIKVLEGPMETQK